MKGKKQDDKEKGGERERERENGHMKQLWVDLKDSREVDNLKKNTICPLDSCKYVTHKSLSVTFTT